MKKSTLFLMSLAAGTLLTLQSWAHCQIPCGIYDDDARFNMLKEHVTTIEKSIKEIARLTDLKEFLTPDDTNQLIRWVNNKEAHADQFTEIVNFYFLAQRIKPTAPDHADYRKYVKQVTLLHQLGFYAMKAKQSTDLAHVEKLRTLVDEFHEAYAH